jgi:hypothetical protein
MAAPAIFKINELGRMDNKKRDSKSQRCRRDKNT